jgi:hypothetical protein
MHLRGSLRLVIVVPAACVLLAVTACRPFGSDEPAAGAGASAPAPSASSLPPGTPGPLPDDICALLPAEDVSAIWERPVSGAVGDKLDDMVPGGRACVYTMSPGRLEVLIKPAGPNDTLRVDSGDVEVRGLGDSAVFFRKSTLAVLWDGYNLALSDERMNLDEATRLEKLKAAATRLHEQLS